MSLSLLSWRRSIAALYAQARAADNPERGWQQWREGRDALFADHPASPLLPEDRKEFTGLPFAPYDPALRWELPVLEVSTERREVPTISDGVVPFERVGLLKVPDLGTLDVWWLDSYGGGIFVPVQDFNRASYKGGRHLIDTVKGADLGGRDGHLIVDLNFAYNPSSAYDASWISPLPPPSNYLDASINAGEMLPT